MVNCVGFTGSQKGMTLEQQTRVMQLLMCEDTVVLACHGGCIGADEIFDSICHKLGIYTQVYLSNIKHKQGNHKAISVALDERPPLERNKIIVRVSQLMIAAPKEYKEILRSGTWATIRYARKTGTPLVIVYPDGSMNKE